MYYCILYDTMFISANRLLLILTGCFVLEDFLFFYILKKESRIKIADKAQLFGVNFQDSVI